MKNRLKIDADQLQLELTGDPDDIRQGYELTRELLISHFQERLARAQADERARQQAEQAARPRGTQRLHTPEGDPEAGRHWTAPSRPLEAMHISIALSSDFYNKVCVLERAEFETSAFGKILDFDAINRLYIRANQRETFRGHFTIGKVLWRELTRNGRAAVRNEDIER